MQLSVQPTLPPVLVHAFPASLVGRTSVAAELWGEEWEALKKATVERAQGRCEVSGAAAAVCGECWQFDDAAAVLRLTALRALSADVHRIEQLLGSGAEPSEEGLQQLQAMNGWSEPDTASYMGHAAEVQRRRSEREWRLDLGLLQQHSVAVPSSLQALVV